MTPNDGPTLGELFRKLEEVTRQLSELPRTLDDTYLRKETYLVQRQADNATIGGVRADLDAIVEQQRQNRRLALSGILLPILATVMAALILVAILP